MRIPRGAVVLVVIIGAAAAGVGCNDPCCTIDSRPIPLRLAPGGALLTEVSVGDNGSGPRHLAVIDTGTPVSIWTSAAGAGARVETRTIELYGASDTGKAPLRASLGGVAAVPGSLGPLGVGDEIVLPRVLLGGEILASFSLEIAFSTAPTLTFWSRQPAPDVFLATRGYAVVRLTRYGAGELETAGADDRFGVSGPHQYGPSLLVIRACAAPDAFDREGPLPAACCRGQERQLATGVDLSLLVATGVGPVVLGRSAWERLRAKLTVRPVSTARALRVATADRPIAAEWVKLPRLTVVDREADLVNDPGPCVELGRARRLEQVAWRQSQSPTAAPCPLPCDTDSGTDARTSSKAQNSAAYLELSGEPEVAIIDDADPLLQSLRAQIRPEGPEIDGLVGAGALRGARVEIDYRNQPARAIFSCDESAAVGSCRSVGRCPRLPGRGQTHICFGLPPHGLPDMCDNIPSSCPN